MCLLIIKAIHLVKLPNLIMDLEQKQEIMIKVQVLITDQRL